MRISTWLGTGFALLLGYTASSQQLKLGKNPYTVQKSAVLELNSDNQGLLLVRLSDTIAINTLTPPDGMVIFFTPTKQLMVRSNGFWQPLTGGTGISSLNGLTTTSQTFATSTTGTNFTISSTGAIHTFNMPDASASARGLVTTGTQTIAGAKTFSSTPLFSSLTAGSIPFIGTGGLLSQNNATLFWDATNFRLGVGTNTPGSDLTIYQSTGATSKGFRFTGNSIGGTNSGTGFALALGFNQTNNKQLWLGDADYMGNSTGTFVRYSSSSGQAILDAVAGDNSIRRPIRIGVGGDANSSVLFGDDNNATTPGSYVWANGNMAVGNGYRSNSAPANGLLVQGNVGIGTPSPATPLQVTGTNPLTLIGVQAGTSTTNDSLLTITSGLVRKLPMSTFATTGSFWALGGNSVSTIKNFGTIDNNHLPFITNNIERMRISNTGNVGIGTTTFDPTNPEKLLIQAGTTTSYNLIEGHGRINNYLQFNIQNDSAGPASSSDLVATSDNGDESVNFVDLGINSSGFSNTGIVGGANNAYLYSTGNNFIIGNASISKSLQFFTGGTLTTNERMRIDGSGHVGIGTTAPTADLHLAAGTATANTAPLKFTTGTSLTTVEDGAVEYDGANYFASVASTRYTLAKTLTATASLNFPATAAGNSATLNITVTGAADGDVVALGVPNLVASTAGVCYTAYVSAANTVTVKMNNYNPLLSLAIDPPAATFRVSVIKY